MDIKKPDVDASGLASEVDASLNVFNRLRRAHNWKYRNVNSQKTMFTEENML